MSETALQLLPELTVLGVLDADNYTPILLLLFILAKPGGGRDGFFFTLGVVATQLAGAMLFAALLKEIDASPSPVWRWLGVYGQGALGVGLIVLGVLLRPKPHAPDEGGFIEAIGHRPLTWGLVGAVVEITKLMTGFVYFDAIRRILEAGLYRVEQAALVGYFNLIAFAPIILIWMIYLIVGARRRQQLSNLRMFLIHHEPLLIKLAVVAVGGFLLVNSLNIGMAPGLR